MVKVINVKPKRKLDIVEIEKDIVRVKVKPKTKIKVKDDSIVTKQNPGLTNIKFLVSDASKKKLQAVKKLRGLKSMGSVLDSILKDCINAKGELKNENI